MGLGVSGLMSRVCGARSSEFRVKQVMGYRAQVMGCWLQNIGYELYVLGYG